MDDMSSLDDASIAWIWIIEYLASFKQIDASILHDLVEMTPELSDDLGKNAREMIALRCLEDLFGPSNGLTKDISSSPESKVEFDLSEGCEDVLQHILKQTSLSDLKMGGPQLLKWDVLPFIMHKRACMPKCALEQLKDAIDEGTDLYAASLKERSELLCRSECDKMTLNNSDHSAVMRRLDGSGSGSQTMADGNLIPSAHENGNGLVGNDSHNGNLLSPKRDRNNFATENLVGRYYGNQDSAIDDDNFHSSAKKCKQDATRVNQSFGQISIPLRGNELLEDNSERIDRFIEGEGCDFTEHNQAEGLEEIRFSEGGHDECVTLKKLGESSDVNDDKSQSNEMEIAHHAHKLTQVMSGDRPVCNITVNGTDNAEHGDVSDDKSQNSEMVITHNALKLTQVRCGDGPFCNFTVNGTDNAEQRTLDGGALASSLEKHSVDEANDRDDHVAYSNGSHHKTNPVEEEMSSDSDEHHIERIDFAKKKSHFFSSHCTLSDDYSATTDWTEQNLCVKCKKAGQLLVCSTSSCPLVVHENCLGSSANFDEKGSFYCPFCAYSHAISEYLEVKKKASLARKKLAAFFHKKRHSERLRRKGQCHSRQNGDKGPFAEVHENGRLGKRENSPAKQNGEDINEVSVPQLQENIGVRRLPSTLF